MLLTDGDAVGYSEEALVVGDNVTGPFDGDCADGAEVIGFCVDWQVCKSDTHKISCCTIVMRLTNSVGFLEGFCVVVVPPGHVFSTIHSLSLTKKNVSQQSRLVSNI